MPPELIPYDHSIRDTRELRFARRVLGEAG